MVKKKQLIDQLVWSVDLARHPEWMFLSEFGPNDMSLYVVLFDLVWVTKQKSQIKPHN